MYLTGDGVVEEVDQRAQPLVALLPFALLTLALLPGSRLLQEHSEWANAHSY